MTMKKDGKEGKLLRNDFNWVCGELMEEVATAQVGKGRGEDE